MRSHSATIDLAQNIQVSLSDLYQKFISHVAYARTGRVIEIYTYTVHEYCTVSLENPCKTVLIPFRTLSLESAISAYKKKTFTF